MSAPRLRAAGGLAAAVLLLHVWLLGTLPKTAGPGWRAEPARAVQVRHLVKSANPTAATSPAAPPEAVPLFARSVSTNSAPQRSTSTALLDTATSPVPAAPDSSPAAQQASEPELPPVEPSPDPGGQNVPVYETQLPPPQTLVFDLRRGSASGRAELDWQPSGAHYQLSMQGHAVGAPQLAWTSMGGLDSAGLAPLRYTESRRGRELRAVNFQRDAGRVTFSGPQIEHPLVAGGQDRLSWMVQLAAVMAANPALAQPQAQVSLWVVGTRGDADVWTFTVQEPTALDLPAGRVDNAIHLVREPRRPYDTQVHVWLDPTRHHLPVQAFLMVRATGVGTEFRLRDLK